MPYETKFITATKVEDLTESVKAHEREGWEFVDVKLSTSPTPADDRTQRRYYTLMLATLRKSSMEPEHIRSTLRDVDEGAPRG